MNAKDRAAARRQLLLVNYRWSPAERARLHFAPWALPRVPRRPPPEQPVLIPRDPREGRAPVRPPRPKKRRP